MIFNPKEFKIKQPVPRALLAALVVCAASLTGIVYLSIATATAQDKASELQKKLTTAEASLKSKVEELASREKSWSEKMERSQADSSAESDNLNRKIAAFAKQAAACEILRARIGR